MSNEADDLSETESGSSQEDAQNLVPSGEEVAAEDAVADDAVVGEDVAGEGVAEEDVAEDAVADDSAADLASAAEDDVVVEDDLDAVLVDEPESVDEPVSAEDAEATEALPLDSSEPALAGADSTQDDSSEDEDVPEPFPTEVIAAAPIPGEGGTTVLPPPFQAADVSPVKPKKRSRTVMIAVISVLAVLAALIVGDRIANATAQKSLAASLQQELTTPDTPKVSIGGFPFATQALAGTFSSIQVSADEVPVHTDVADLTITHLDAKLTGITVTDKYASIMANRGEATALVDWEEASKLAGQPVTYVADNQMQIDFTIPIGQLSIKGSILGRPVLNAEDQTISVADPKFTLSNMDVPQPISEAVSKIALQPFPIRGLPYDIKITALAIQPDGISVSGSGANIPIREQQ
ncbi:MAG: DUF2993 domain-containing protein [Microlunatus sp.]